MSIRIVGHGFEISTPAVDEGQAVSYRYNGADASFTVDGFNDAERRRGWKHLGSGHGDVLAYRVDDAVVLLRKPGMDFMGQMPDERSLAEVTLAGSHESCSLTGGFISECHNVDLAQQLRDGCRFVDIRLKVIDNELRTYHGVQPQNSTFAQQVEWIEAFLREHPRETVVVSIKQEDDDHPEFTNRIYDLIHGSGLWRFAGGIPRLGDVRGRAILFSRFACPYSEGAGIAPSSWPNSVREGFEWDCDGVPFRIQDWYDIPGAGAIGDKAQALIDHLGPTTERRDPQPFTLSFATASKFPDATPKTVATGAGGGVADIIGAGANLFAALKSGGPPAPKAQDVGVNARLTKWLLERAVEGKRPRAVVMLDFYRDNMTEEGNLATLLAALNFATDN